MTSPVGMAIATITVMLWIMWSDTLRARRPSPVLYVVRIALYLIASAILVFNLIRSPQLFAGDARLLAILAVVIGLIGAGYFARRLITRT